MIQMLNQTLQRPRVEFAIVCLLLFVVITASHGARIQQNWSQLHWEDQLFFDHDRRTIHSLRDCWTQPSLWPGLYRPLTTNCYYFVGRQFFHHQIEYYHALNILFYAGNALLLYCLARWLLHPLYALLAMMLFASRSAHAEIVTNTVEFQVLAATTFALLALQLFVVALHNNRWRLLPIVYLLLLLALLSKEAKLATIPMLPLYLWLFVRPLRWSYLWAAFATAAGSIGLLLLTQRALTAAQSTGFSYTTAPTLVLRNLAAHFWSFSNRLVRIDQDVVMPVAVQNAAESALGQAVLIFYATMSLLMVASRQQLSAPARVCALGGLYFLLAALPYSFFTDRLFMRYGYFSHVGLALTIAAATAWSSNGLHTLWSRSKLQTIAAHAARWFWSG